MRSGADIISKVDIGSPIFDKITIHLNSNYYEGNAIEIIASGNSNTNRYIQEALWNGIKLRQLEMNHGDLTKGGVLKLDMGDTPNKSFR